MAKFVTLQATYRIVTPMFLSGADPNKLADTVRPPSVKGALRFWWRFLYWGTFRANRDEETAIQSMRDREDELFGSSKTGQGKFSLTVSAKLGRGVVNDWPANNTGSGYLGLGLFPAGDHPGRTAFPEQTSSFDVKLLFHPRANQEDICQLKRALLALGLFGGLGARGQRRGFGSVAIQQLGQMSLMFQNGESYLERARSFLTKVTPTADCPPFSAVSQATEIAAIATGDDAREVHNELGAAYKNFREQLAVTKDRIPFGLPLATVDQERRRASPLLFHVHPTGNPKFTGIALFIPAMFHPDQNFSGISLDIVKQFMSTVSP